MSDLLFSHAKTLRDLPGNEGDVGGFVALAAMGLGGQERRVCLQQDPFQWKPRDDRAARLPIRIGNRSANSKHKTNFCHFLSQLEVFEE